MLSILASILVRLGGGYAGVSTQEASRKSLHVSEAVNAGLMLKLETADSNYCKYLSL